MGKKLLASVGTKAYLNILLIPNQNIFLFPAFGAFG